MSFTSLAYIFLLFGVSTFQKKLKSIRNKNIVLISASFLFYAAWDFRFFGLILVSSVLDYVISARITKSKRKVILLAFSLIGNIGTLFVFKYFNFFITQFELLFGLEHSLAISLILPAGISFYTFQTLGYTLDVYQGKINAEKDFLTFLAFVSFFPQLVAGPIERARDLLPQLQRNNEVDSSVSILGINEFLWGAFKKVVLADNIAPYVDEIFGNTEQYGSNILFLGLVLFSLQIYFDFSGYSHMAIGSARILGIKLTKNFNKPYFAKSIGEFWSRWHITLSRWFKDYIYIPLGGNRRGVPRRIYNTGIVFVVSGLWHGANWTFICWGLVHFLGYLTEIVLKGKFVAKWYGYVITQSFVLIAWLFFRSDNISAFFVYLKGLFAFTTSWYLPRGSLLFTPFVLSICLIAYEFFDKRDKYFLPYFAGVEKRFTLMWLALVALLIIALAGSSSEFIYFQF